MRIYTNIYVKFNLVRLLVRRKRNPLTITRSHYKHGGVKDKMMKRTGRMKEWRGLGEGGKKPVQD